MKPAGEIRKIACRTIIDEAKAIENLQNFIDEDFVNVVKLLLNSKGRAIFTGIGKSANIAVKTVATLNSTGTPAIFMHAADAIHGDLGSVQDNDIVFCLSKSGNTPEIKVLIPLLKNLGNTIVAIVGNTNSYLAQQSDYVLNTTVEREACPNNLAPTSSTTAQLVMGDALAVCLLECRGFSTSDFARYHPGGALGKQLYLKVEDLFHTNEAPFVNKNDDIRKTIVEISSKRLGCAAVLDNGILVGMVTDGDLRRMLQKNEKFDGLTAGQIMTNNPKTIHPETLLVEALATMRANNITQLLVVEEDIYKGVIHLHDILREGII